MKIEKLPHDHGTHTEEILKDVDLNLASTDFEDAADTFALLADSSRLKIFWLLCHTEECVANIAAAVGMSAPAVSHHLKLLKSARVIESRKDGKEVYYRLADNYSAQLLHRAVDSILDVKIPGICD